MKIKIKRKKLRHSYGCACNDPDCASYLMGKICEMVGHDIPCMTREEFAETTGFSKDFCDHFLECHAVSHNLLRVLSGAERLGALPFVIRFPPVLEEG